jgi:hypothetical protein
MPCRAKIKLGMAFLKIFNGTWFIDKIWPMLYKKSDNFKVMGRVRWI